METKRLSGKKVELFIRVELSHSLVRTLGDQTNLLKVLYEFK